MKTPQEDIDRALAFEQRVPERLKEAYLDCMNQKPMSQRKTDQEIRAGCILVGVYVRCFLTKLFCPVCREDWYWEGEPIALKVAEGEEPKTYTPKPTQIGRATCVACHLEKTAGSSKRPKNTFRQRMGMRKTGG